jgi:hypothetical protein
MSHEHNSFCVDCGNGVRPWYRLCFYCADHKAKCANCKADLKCEIERRSLQCHRCRGDQ